MFICDDCKSNVGPRVSPTLSIESRTKSYLVTREVELIGEIQDVVIGSEIVREFKLCPTCSNTKPTVRLETPKNPFEQPLAPTFMTSLGALAVESLLMRADDATKKKSKRAQRDFDAAYPLLKGYEKRGGGI